MKAPKITKECVKTLFETKFIKLFDLQYEEGKHYFDATRRNADELVATKTKEDYLTLLPDAVTCVVILNIKDEEPRLLLAKEFRYPAGQFLLSPPAGLIDPEDADTPCKIEATILNEDRQPANINAGLFSAATREIEEETGIVLTKDDTISVISPFLFSTPGMTDECNGFVQAIVNRDTMPNLVQTGAVGSECFDGFILLTKEEAREILKRGRDEDGIYYSVFTWAAMTYFVADLWK